MDPKLATVVHWKVWWTNSRTTAETEEVLLSSVMSAKELQSRLKESHAGKNLLVLE